MIQIFRLKGIPSESEIKAIGISLAFFDHIHRFMPAMVRREGWEVVTVPVTHAPRISGRSKYNNLQRARVGAIDLLGVAWLIRRRQLPAMRELPMSLIADTATCSERSPERVPMIEDAA